MELSRPKDRFRGGIALELAAASGFAWANEAVDEAQFPHDRRHQNEGIEVQLAHAVVQTVDRIGEGQPGLEKGIEIVLSIGIEINGHGERGIASGLGGDAHTEGGGMMLMPVTQSI